MMPEDVANNVGQGRNFKRLIWFAATVSMLLLAAAAEEPAPSVVTAACTSADAPVVEARMHGRAGQNVSIRWRLLANGPAAGTDALYIFSGDASYGRMDEHKTPFMSQMDLRNGSIRNFFANTRLKWLERAVDDMMGDKGEDQIVQANWGWGSPLCGVRGEAGELLIGAGDEKSGAVLKYQPARDLFEHHVRLPQAPAAICLAQGVLWSLAADGSLCRVDDIAFEGERTVERLGRLAPDKTNKRRALRVLASDKSEHLYAATGPAPFQLFAVAAAGAKLQVKRLFAGRPLAALQLHAGEGEPWCSLRFEGEDAPRFFRLRGGVAKKLEQRPALAVKTRHGNTVRLLMSRLPPSVSVVDKAGKEKVLPIVFENVAYDNIKVLHADPANNVLYGTGWPVSNIWRFDPATGAMTKLGKHYVIYEMHQWGDEIWMAGYFGIKFMRWRPDQPWTFDYSKHYYKKRYPGNSSPWGDKGVSNPRLVCKFRYLKKHLCRRPGGMTIAPDGRAYVGARTPPVRYLESRYGGALNWYDPESETIGQIREPFLHHSVRDVCSGGERYVAAVASTYISPYEPLPEDFSHGKFVLYDTKDKKVVLESSPLDTPLSYCEEGEPGRIVVVGYAGKYRGEGVRGAFFIFDVNEMRVTHVIRTPFKVRWAEYNVLPFVRGPDRKIYFYGSDQHGAALFRIDSRDGKIEPVLRGRHITDVATYNNKGAAFAFLGDRVYFGCKALVSVPLATVMTPAKGNAP